MNPPKISETNMADEHLGRRDAFHVPVVLARSAEYLVGGEFVKFTNSAFTHVVSVDEAEFAQGVVSPWIHSAWPGQLFWVMLKPDTTSNLTHHFDIEGAKDKAAVLDEVAKLKAKVAELKEELDQDGCRGCYD